MNEVLDYDTLLADQDAEILAQAAAMGYAEDAAEEDAVAYGMFI
jgi:hypothetical protein